MKQLKTTYLCYAILPGRLPAGLISRQFRSHMLWSNGCCAWDVLQFVKSVAAAVQGGSGLGPGFCARIWPHPPSLVWRLPLYENYTDVNALDWGSWWTTTTRCTCVTVADAQTKPPPCTPHKWIVSILGSCSYDHPSMCRFYLKQ